MAPVTGARAVGPPLTVHDPTGEMVGREEALARLNGFLQKACSGQRQLVFVTRDSGHSPRQHWWTLSCKVPPPSEASDCTRAVY